MDKKIKPIEYLGENYDAVSEFCNSCKEPMFFEKGGQMALVAMSIKSYEEISGCCDLHTLFENELANGQEK